MLMRSAHEVRVRIPGHRGELRPVIVVSVVVLNAEAEDLQS